MIVGPPTSVVMPPCDESWNETGPNDDMGTIPVLEAQALSPTGLRDMEESFPGAGEVISSMPPMPAGDLASLSCKEPPPPPAGVPTVPPMSQTPHQMAVAQSPTHRSEQMAPSPLNMAVVANGQYEQQPQPLQCPVSPVGYMTCGTYQ